MVIKLHYRNKDVRVLDAPYGMRHPADGSRPIMAELDAEAFATKGVYEAVDYALDVQYTNGCRIISLIKETDV